MLLLLADFCGEREARGKLIIVIFFLAVKVFSYTQGEQSKTKIVNLGAAEVLHTKDEQKTKETSSNTTYEPG